MGKDELQGLFADHRLYHSEFQMDWFITSNAGGTVYGCFKQALRELHRRYRGLKGLYLKRKKVLLEKDEVEVKYNSAHTPLAKQLLEVEHAEKYDQLEELELEIRDTEREFRHFYSQAVNLKKQVGELTPEKVAALEQELWVYQLRKRAALESVAHGAPSLQTIEAVYSLPPELRQRVDLVPDRARAWIAQLESVRPVPVERELLEVDVRGLIE